MDKLDMFSVHLGHRRCSCRKWDLTGIPCSHAVASLAAMRMQPEPFVSDWFKKGRYGEAYSGSIRLINGERHWPQVDMKLAPLRIKPHPGRPKKNRRKDPQERFDKKGKLTRHGMQMTCTICNQKNHNRRSCPQRATSPSCEAPAPPQQARHRGRPRKDGAPPMPTPPVNPTQQKRTRGRPKRVAPTENHGFAHATILSQTMGAPGPSQSSQPSEP